MSDYQYDHLHAFRESWPLDDDWLGFLGPSIDIPLHCGDFSICPEPEQNIIKDSSILFTPADLIPLDNPLDSIADAIKDLPVDLGQSQHAELRTDSSLPCSTSPSLCESLSSTSTTPLDINPPNPTLHTVRRSSISTIDRVEPRFLCPQPGCRAAFIQRRQLDNHKRRVHTSYKCNACSNAYPHRKSLWEHTQAVHRGIRHICHHEGCDYDTAKRANLRRHQINKHGNDIHDRRTDSELPPVFPSAPVVQEQFSCLDCALSFSSNRELLGHARIHSESARKHECDICSQSFLYPKDLERHKWTHEDVEKPELFCPVESCERGAGGRSFSRKDKLRDHVRIVHPEKAKSFEPG